MASTDPCLNSQSTLGGSIEPRQLPVDYQSALAIKHKEELHFFTLVDILQFIGLLSWVRLTKRLQALVRLLSDNP